MVDKQRMLHWVRDAILMANEACGFTSPLQVLMHSTRGVFPIRLWLEVFL